MPRKKSEIAKRKVNYYVPEDLLTELEQFRRDGESDTDFYTRLMEEGRARLKGILTGETPIDPVVEAQVLAVLQKHGIPLPNLSPSKPGDPQGKK